MSKGFSLLGRGKAQAKPAARADGEATETEREDEAETAAPENKAEPAPAPAPEKEGGSENNAQASGKVVDINAAQRTERARAVAIADMCQIAGRPELAGAFIAENQTEDQVRAALLEAQAAEADQTAVHGQHTGGHSGAPAGETWRKVLAKRGVLKKDAAPA